MRCAARPLRPPGRERGATLVEYALVISLVVVVSLAAVSALEDSSSDRLEDRAGTAGGQGEAIGVLPSASGGGGGGGGSPTDPGSTTYEASVGSLTGSASDAANNKWIAQAVVIVVDSDGNPIPGITVSGVWSLGGTGPPDTTTSCVTDSNGSCTLQRTDIQDNRPSATFTISGMSSTDSSIIVNYTVPTPPDQVEVACLDYGVC